MRQKSESFRIEIGGDGFGEAGDSVVRKRARELARLNGRDFPSEHDYRAAWEELRNLSAESPDELQIEAVEGLGSGVAPASQGHRTSRLEPDDAFNASEFLFQEGMDEAERDARLRSLTD